MEILDFFISGACSALSKYGHNEEYTHNDDQTNQDWPEVNGLAADVVRVLEAELSSFFPQDTGFAPIVVNLEVVDVGARPSVDTLDRNRVQSVTNGRIAESNTGLCRLSEEALVASRPELHGRCKDLIVNLDGHF